MLDKILTLLYLAIGVLFVYSGFTKKGMLFENPNVKADKKEQYKQDMTKFVFLGGPILSAGAIMELLALPAITYTACYTVVVVLSFMVLYRMKKYS